MKKTAYIAFLFLLALAGCSRELPVRIVDEDCIVKPGDPVAFSSDLSSTLATKAEGYQYVVDTALYEFRVEMYKDGVLAPIGSSTYVPKLNPTEEEAGTLVLKEGELPLYWEDNVNPYGFKAEAGSENLVLDTSGESDQSTLPLFIQNDRLVGYAAVGEDVKTTLNTHILKDWIAANRTAGIATEAEYKKIPLYLRHEKSLVTVILKASEGVKREDLRFETQADNIKVGIFSYAPSTNSYITVRPLAEQTTVSYEKDVNGPAASGVETTCYHAIIDPTDFLTVSDSDPICTVNLSGQSFSYYAGSDPNVNLWKVDKSSYPGVEAAYKLAAGKHLIITATLSRSSRKVLMTAYVEDWTEIAMTTICDDYGKNGDPVVVTSADELYDALTDDDVNALGNVIMLSSDIDLRTLTKNGGVWPDNLALRCLLNMSGRKITTQSRLFASLSSAATLVNGSVDITADVPSAIAEVNYGTIERVSIAPATDITAIATVAGFVETNHRTIFNCTSDVPIKGSANYVGGIAGQSLYENGVAPVIDGCTVNAKVDFAGAGVTVGGIVAKANGRVSGNRYEYGVTLSQQKSVDHQEAKIVSAIVAESAHAEDTPLTMDSNTYPSEYKGIIDSYEDLKIIFDNYGELNNSDNTFRVSGDFTMKKGFGAKDNDPSYAIPGNVLFHLDGNGKTITVAPEEEDCNFMLFRNILGSVRDLTICVDAPVKTGYIYDSAAANHPFDDYDAVAPFAYSVAGGKLSGIRVYTTANGYIRSTHPAGIAVWAYDSAVIEGCEFCGSLRGHDTYDEDDPTDHLAGGIVAVAEKASFNACVFHSGSTYSGGNSNTYFGGILGGVVDRAATTTVTPKVTMIECVGAMNAAPSVAWGALVGSAVYGNASASGIETKDCQGNWWPTAAPAVGKRPAAAENDVKVVGRRNAIQPKVDTDWYK